VIGHRDRGVGNETPNGPHERDGCSVCGFAVRTAAQSNVLVRVRVGQVHDDSIHEPCQPGRLILIGLDELQQAVGVQGDRFDTRSLEVRYEFFDEFHAKRGFSSVEDRLSRLAIGRIRQGFE